MTRLSLDTAQQRYNQLKSEGLQLDLTRGKPGPEQLDLSLPMLTLVNERQFKTSVGLDCRNYGLVDGIPEAKQLFAEVADVDPDEVLIGGNSSLNLMYDTLVRALLHGTHETGKPWIKEKKVRFICPVPGYDRHFGVCQDLGVEMIPVMLTGHGPDMNVVEKLVAEDESIRGMWCVPKYSNPTGETYSDEVVEALAAMTTKAEDFRIFWDNAYSEHHLTNHPKPLMNMLRACEKAGNPDRVYMFGSTSKITFPGAGVSFIATSKNNGAFIRRHLSKQTIGHDKLNQLRHVLFFKNLEGIQKHMLKHRAIITPRFQIMDQVLTDELAGSSLATWSLPEGGYFISLDTQPNCAKRVVTLALEAGVKLTAAGATYPNGLDPQDKNLRLAPTLPGLDELRKATEVLALCIQIAALEK